MNKNERSPLDSELLHTFSVIAATGTLTQAADRLGRTQSAISVQLRKLETGLGAPLFSRTAKGMALTQAGEALLPRAKAILADLREAARLITEPLTGSIRVGLPDDFDETQLEKILMAFSQTHPGVQVMATSGCTAGYPDAIADGALDVAIFSGPPPHDGAFLDQEETVWATRRGAPLRARDAVPLAILDRSCWWRDMPIKALDAAGIRYEIAFRSSSFASLQAALRAGFAIGVLPRSSLSSTLQTLGEAEGVPNLPVSRRSILVSRQAPQPLAKAMLGAIRQASFV